MGILGDLSFDGLGYEDGTSRRIALGSLAFERAFAVLKKMTASVQPAIHWMYQITFRRL